MCTRSVALMIPTTSSSSRTTCPCSLPHGGPNYYSFGENIRYEVHIDNDVSTTGDDIIYRFTFNKENEDPSTFFNVRLGLQNQKTTYTLERSIDGGSSFQVVKLNGVWCHRTTSDSAASRAVPD
jgi:hypothetical protein